MLASRIRIAIGGILLLLLSVIKVNAQNTHFTSGALDVDVFVSNPCGGGPNNGFIRFTVNNAANGASGSVSVFVFSGFGSAFQPGIPVGSVYTYDPAKDLAAGTYNFVISDENPPHASIVNSVVLTNLAPITVVDNGTNLTNASCASPTGKIAFDITGGSKALAGGGSYSYTITSTNAVVGFPLSGTYDGTTTLDVTTLLNATNPPIGGLPGGTYTLTLTDKYSVCGASKIWTITDPSPIAYNTTAATPQVCLGNTGSVQLSNSEGNNVLYEIYKGGVATGITQTGTNSVLNFTIPSSLLPAAGSYAFTIRATNGLCSPNFMNGTAIINVNPLPVPTITGLASICTGTSGVGYSTETGELSYTWSVTGGVITSGAGTSAIVVTWTTSGAQSVNVNYSDLNGCTASTPTNKIIAVNPNPVPTITGSASVCIGSTGINYTTETGKSAYLWSVTGGTITGGAATNVITVSWTSAGPQSVSVNYTDALGCVAAIPTVKPITVNNLPVPTIAGPASTCLSSNSIYTSEVGNSAYVWTVSPGGTIISGAATSSLTVNWTTTGVKTITVSYVDANGCTPSTPTSKSVTVNPLPNPTITGPVAVCSGTSGVSYSTEVANSGYLWTVSGGGIITAGAGTSAITVTWNTAGPQTVTVNYSDINGCTAAAPTVSNVTVNPLPVPTITGSAIVCVGSTGVSYATETGMTGYTWTVSGGTIATGTNTSTITVNWNTTGPQTISVNYVDVNGCAASTPTVLPITVNTLPVPTITGNLSACLNSVSNTYTTETGNSAYLWTVTGGVISAGAGTSSVTVTWTTVGAESISVNYTNVNGCAAATPTVQSVTVNPLPVPTISGSLSVCVGSIGIVYTTETGKSGYNWSVTGGTITAGTGTNSITVDWTASGPQQISVDYTDVNGCTAASPVTQAITVNALPVPLIAGSPSVCANSTGNTYSTAAGNAGYVWTVSAGGTLVSGAGTNIISVTWNTAGPQSVTVNYTDANGCAAASPTSKAVTVNPLPLPTITGPLSACVGSTGNTYATESGNSAYVWTVAGGTITSGAATNSIVVTWSSSGTQNVSVTYTDVNGCSAAAPVVQPVTVIAQPIPTISGTNSVCAGATGVIYSTETGKSGYNWNVTGGSIVSGAGTSSVTVDWITAGAQTITVNYTDVSGCSAPAPTSMAVTVNTLPVPTVTGNATVCLNSAGNVYTTETGNAGYFWSVSAGGTINSGAGTSTVSVTWTAPGSQTLSVTYVDANGCSPSAPSAKTINVNNLPAPTISGPSPVCSGTTGATYITEAGNLGYVWTISGGVITAGSTTDAVTVTWGSVGAGNLTVTYSDINGCSPTTPASLPIAINNTPDATINPAGPFCSNNSAVTLTPLNAGGTWSGTGITNTATGTFDPAIAGPGTFVISYSLVLGTCSDTKNISILVNPAPDATITPAGPFCITDPATTLTAATAGGTWSGTGITNPATGAFSPSTAGVGTFTISYTVATAAGCTDTKTTSIAVGNIPDATITPVGPFCSNDPVVTLVAATSGGTWTGTGITNASTGTFDPSLVVGSSTITYSITVGGCSDSKTTTIAVNTAPNATITAAGPFCISDPAATLTAVSPGGTWSGTGITNAATGTFDPATAGVGTWSITYTVSNVLCTDTKSISIVVANPPDATISPAGPLCTNGLPVTLTAATSGGTWSGSGITSASAGTFDPSTTGAGSFVITYSIVIGGCSDTKTTTAVVKPAPDATITPAGPFCTSDAAVTLSAATPGGIWSGTGITNTATGLFDPSTLTPATYPVTYSVTVGGCTDTQTANIIVSGPPDATITAVSPLCNTDLPVQLVAATPGGTWSGPGVSAVGVFNPAASGIGNIIITYTVTIGSCTDSKTTTIVVTQCGPTGCIFTAPVTDTLPSCTKQDDGSITINVSGGTAPYIVSIDTAGFHQAQGGIGPIFNFSNLSPGYYTYTISDGAGNVCTLPHTLKLQTGIVAQGSNFTDALCFDGAGSATITVVSGGASPYEYSIDGGITWVSFTSPVTITDLMASANAYSVLVRDDPSDLCIASVLVSVGGPAAALDTLFVTRTISLPDLSTGAITVGIQESGQEPYQSRLELITPLFTGQSFVQDWTTVVRNPNDLKFEITYTSLFAGVYKLSIRDALGCEKDYTINLDVDKNIFIPNVFTPNGDGVNDKFVIRNLPAETSVIISNRWGQEIFSAKDYTNSWDGGSISDGMYYYRIKGAGKVYTGWLEIIRGN